MLYIGTFLCGSILSLAAVISWTWKVDMIWYDITMVACMGHAISWSVSSALSLQTWNFEFTNTKFWVYNHEISSFQTQKFSNLTFLVYMKFRVYKLKTSSLQTQNFEFTNTKFQVYKHEILSLQTWSFEFSNSKFRVYKHKILSLQTWNSGLKLEILSLQTRNNNFKFVNSKYFEFVNSKFHVCKLKISSLKLKISSL